MKRELATLSLNVRLKHKRKIPLQPPHRSTVMAQRRERTLNIPLQPEELEERLSEATRHAASLKREIAAVPQREAPPPARAPGQGAADIVRLRHQIAHLRGKVDVAERALRSELEDGQTSLAAAVENKVDGYFAESARLRRALHEQQQPHAANAPAAELRKLREQERQLRADVAQARAEHEFVHRALVQEDRDGAALAAELRRADSAISA